MTLTLERPTSREATSTRTMPVIVSLLDTALPGPTFHGRSVLECVVSRLTRHGFEPIVLARREQAPTLPTLEGARIELVDAPATPESRMRAAALRWLDGWRGGLMRYSHYDRGLDAAVLIEVLKRLDLDQAIILDAASMLFDPGILRTLFERLEDAEQFSLSFCPATPGIAAVAMKREFVEKLAVSRATVGTALTYTPASPSPDPLSSPACVNAPKPLTQTRTSLRVTPNNVRLIERLIASDAFDADEFDVAEIIRALEAESSPRDVTVELTTRRHSRPVDWRPLDRADLTLDQAQRVFAEIAQAGARLTLGGWGDPTLHPQFSAMVAMARQAGVEAIHVETELLGDDLALLAMPGIDVVSVHLPAMSAETYQAVMGCDGYMKVLENLKQLIAARARNGSMTPILVPTFTKLQANLGEMEAWYDQWLRALGSAAIVAPRDESLAVADMTPARRRPCVRLAQRLTVLSNGRATTCEVDCHGGQSTDAGLVEAWHRFGSIRSDHAAGAWDRHPVCSTCRSWHQL